MADHQVLPEIAAQCAAMTDKEREVMDILLSLPELIADFSSYGEDQLIDWGWKKRRSAVNSPLTPLPSPDSSPPRKLEKLNPRVAHTEEQLVQETITLTQRKKDYQQEKLLQQINVLMQRREVLHQELLKVQSHLEKQIIFNKTLQELTAGATTLAPCQTLL